MVEKLEDALEYIWLLEENGENTIRKFLEKYDENFLKELIDKKYVELRDEKLFLIGKGKEIAKNIIRRHRLAEFLLYNVFELEEKSFEEFACKFEHIVDEEITDKICTFLGHPPYCPHGREIPRGKCCLERRREIESIIKPLTELEPGRNAEIVYFVTESKSLTDSLVGHGLMPKKRITLKQKSPIIIIKVGENLISIDKEIAKRIYVKELD